MKNILFVVFSAISFISCQDEVTFNNPGFQAIVNNQTWKGNYTKAQIDKDGKLTIEAGFSNQLMILKTNSNKPGTYNLGTTNQDNIAQLNSLNANTSNFLTGIATAPINTIKLVHNGSGYQNANLVETIGGTGTGLKLNIITSNNGEVVEADINLAGNGYKPGDLIKIKGGDNNAEIEVRTVSKSGGVITITENTGSTISGTFRFTAFSNNSGEVISCRDGVFYKIPIK